MSTHLDPLAEVAGFRAIVHLSLIALHSAMLTTAHLPSSGPEWTDVKSNIIYTGMQAGGVQVDLLFMLSGFLLSYKYLVSSLKGRGKPSLVNYIVSRALRLLPPVIAVSGLGLLMGDTWDIDKDDPTYAPIWMRLFSMYSFVLNYVPAGLYGSFTLSLCWSLCVDMHSGALITLFVSALKRVTGRVDAHHLRIVFFVWLVVSLATRAFLFEENSLNIFRLGQYSHFGLLMTDNSRKWIEQRFSHTWLTPNSAKALAQTYIDNMYNPTHTRYGPFAVGGILGCNLYLATLSPGRGGGKAGSSWLYRAIGWFWTINAVTMLAIPCLPSDDNAPIEAQFFATAALRTIAAASGAFLLYTALVPADHGWSWRLLSKLLASPYLAPIAELSYCSYLLHFRVLMELCLSHTTRDLLSWGLERGDWVSFMPRLFVAGTVASLALAFFLHNAVERPFLRITTNQTREKDVKSYSDLQRNLKD